MDRDLVKHEVREPPQPPMLHCALLPIHPHSSLISLPPHVLLLLPLPPSRLPWQKLMLFGTCYDDLVRQFDASFGEREGDTSTFIYIVCGCAQLRCSAPEATVSHAHLLAATHHLYHKHPLLRAVLVEEPGGRWRLREDPGAAASFDPAAHLSVRPRTSARAWQTVVQDEMAKGMGDLFAKPAWRVVCLQDGPDLDLMIIFGWPAHSSINPTVRRSPKSILT